jgi:hypothetical protein
VDFDAALEEITGFREDLEAVSQSIVFESPGMPQPATVAVKKRISERLPMIMAIADELRLPHTDRIREWNNFSGTFEAIHACNELVGIIANRERLEQIMGPTGPRLSASAMHRWVWSAAAELWDDGHPRPAVQQAATALFDGHLPAKLKLSKGAGGTDPSSAFSDKPPAIGSPRLRLPQYPDDGQDRTSAHEGARFLGMACQKLVRNLTTHSHESLDEDIALEYLAMLSAFARLVDEAIVEDA